MPKWITNAGPNEPVVRVAAASLRARLKRVRRYLPRAAEQAEQDTEHIHQLRVWTRRASAAMEIFRTFLPGKRSKWVRAQLKRIRRAAGEARDLDVLLDRLAQWSDPPGDLSPLMNEVRQRRQAAQPRIVEVHRQLTTDNLLKRRCRELVRRVRIREKPSTSETYYGPWADQQLASVLEPFFDAAADDLADLEKLHVFRIAGKRLRYTMELVAGAYPRRFRKELYGKISHLQEKLGAINDHRVAEARLLSWAEETPGKSCARLLKDLAALEASGLHEQRDRFFEWWSPQQSQALRDSFDEMLQMRCWHDD